MKETIVFSPDVDDWELGREIDKTDEELQPAGRIEPELGAVNTGDFGLNGRDRVSTAGWGLRTGVRIGAGIQGIRGLSSLASRILKPIGCVATSTAVPVAVAGTGGAGMLSAMHGASAVAKR